MIRVILRRLIIPCGNTGSFTLPVLQTAEAGDIAVLAIYDPLYRKTLVKKEAEIRNEQITFNFEREDTINIEPDDRYQWDVTIYRNPTRNDQNEIVNGEIIDSYYSAFNLPTCEIKVAP